ncbi:MAG: acyl-CoA thioesterase II [Polyangiaceae bacterium]|nr:acyl-CoA thioesterase II [Polyangiaceae bacterium]
MNRVLRELVALLELERIEENLFRGQSQDLGWGTVYGGQVVGQALSAAVQTVPSDRRAHSLHAYFLRPGAVDKPIVYNVDRIRDGGTFTTRRVVAIQNGQAILNLAASFQKDEEGFFHQDTMPRAPEPGTVPTDQERMKAMIDKLPELMQKLAGGERAFEIRQVGDAGTDLLAPSKQPPSRQVWLRASDKLPDSPALHQYLLAYASDYAFLTTSLLPHGVSWLTPGMQVASLDHAVWFYAPFRLDDWLLHSVESPVASGGRGLVHGKIFNKQGHLVASTAQEGLIRQRK